jgi:hypothetical protein
MTRFCHTLYARKDNTNYSLTPKIEKECSIKQQMFSIGAPCNVKCTRKTRTYHTATHAVSMPHTRKYTRKSAPQNADLYHNSLPLNVLSQQENKEQALLF